MSDNNELQNNKEEILDFISRKPWIFLGVLTIIGLSIRLYFFPNDLPPTGDAIGYFWYANDMSILGQFPELSYKENFSPPPNNGWPAFLSIFFAGLNSTDFLEYVELQRIITVIISTFTIFPVYFLAKKFVAIPFAIISSSFFIFDPRLIENSLLGITESAFLFLGVSSIALFLSKKRIFIITSFAVAGLFTLVRYEGLLILVPMIIIFFMRYYKNKREYLTFSLCIFIFLLVIFPMALIRIDTTGNDGIVSHFSAGPIYYATTAEESADTLENIYVNFLIKGIFFMSKYFGLLLIPMFIVFLPIGIFEIFRKRNYKKWTLVIFGLVFLIPAFYAYSRGFEDTRYLFFLIPIFSIFAGYTISRISNKIKKPKMVFYGSLTGLIVMSFISTSVIIFDFQEEKELYHIVRDIDELTGTINRDFEGVSYIKWTSELIEDQFPITQIELHEKNPTSGKIVIIGKLSMNEFDTLKEYLEFGKKENLTHLVLNGKNMNTEFLQDIFFNEKEYVFLKKIYDSKEIGYELHVKIFEIDYDKMNIFFENKLITR